MEEEEERFSYMREAERELRRAEEREAERERLNQDYLARKARGELTEEEVCPAPRDSWRPFALESQRPLL